MRILINNFRGAAPRIEDDQLADGLAVRAVNVDVSESLQGWFAPVLNGKTFLTNRRYFHRYTDSLWFSWQYRTHAVPSPITNDQWNYAIITDTAYPKITRSDVAISGGNYPAVSYRLGLPIPDAITAFVQDNTEYTGALPESPEYDGSLTDEFDTSYIITFVDKWGRESATSAPSNTVTIREYDSEMVLQVELTLPTVPSGYPLIQSGGKFRIYRLNNASDGSGIYQFLDEIPVTQTTYTDRKQSYRLLEGASTQSHVGPPDDDTALYPNGALQNISVVSEAFLCGNNNKMVCFSEPNYPHAWPVDYYQIFSERVIRAVAYGSDVAVLTDEFPYVLTGVHPSSMGRIKMSRSAPCVNADAVAVVAGAVVYAGARGLYALTNSDVNLISESFFDLKQWRELEPESMRFSSYNDTLFMLLSDGRLLAIDMATPTNGVHEIAIPNVTIKALYEDVKEGRLFFVDSTGKMHEFEGSNDRLSVTYETKHYRFHQPVNFYVARVRANKYPVSVTFNSKRLDGTTSSFTKIATNDKFFYLPALSQMTEWWASVTGDVDIRSIAFSTTIEELNADV